MFRDNLIRQSCDTPECRRVSTANFCLLVALMALSTGCQTFPIEEALVPENSRVMVVAYRQSPGTVPVVDRDLGTSAELLLRQKGFLLVNRQDTDLIFGEAAFSNTGAVSPEQALQIGRMSSAQFLAALTRTDYNNGTLYSARLTDLNSAEVVSVTQKMTGTPGQPFPQLIQDLVAKTTYVEQVQEPNDRYCNMNSIVFWWKLWFKQPLSIRLLSTLMGGPFYMPIIATAIYPFEPNQVLDTKHPAADRRQLAQEECPKAKVRLARTEKP